MIKRIIASLAIIIFFCQTVWANWEVDVKLDGKNRVFSEMLGPANITFEYLYYLGNTARVRVSVENITPDAKFALLVFRRNSDAKSLKRGKPKIEFERKYAGEKSVKGCNIDCQRLNIITAAETDTLFTLDVPLSSARDINLPVYVAKYKPKDLNKKGKNDIKYKIFEECLFNIHIEVAGWTENDSTYVNAKNCIAQFVASLDGVEFCPHRQHRPSLKAQQLPYQEKKDSLINAINNIFETNQEWMSTDAPYKAYAQLLSELNEINLDAFVSDCGNHHKIHKCSYCSLSAQEIFHRLDDMYQQIHAGKLTKNEAMKTARGMYSCYRQNKNRKKDNSYGGKITKFYNRIANY